MQVFKDLKVRFHIGLEADHSNTKRVISLISNIGIHRKTHSFIYNIIEAEKGT